MNTINSSGVTVDANGNPVVPQPSPGPYRLDANGRPVLDTHGNPVRAVQPSYDSAGNLISPDRSRSEFQLDARGNIVTDAQGNPIRIATKDRLYDFYNSTDLARLHDDFRFFNDKVMAIQNSPGPITVQDQSDLNDLQARLEITITRVGLIKATPNPRDPVYAASDTSEVAAAGYRADLKYLSDKITEIQSFPGPLSGDKKVALGDMSAKVAEMASRLGVPDAINPNSIYQPAKQVA